MISKVSPAGLWWQEHDVTKPLEQTVREASDRYTEKYGGVADTCYVHPSVMGDHAAGAVVSLGNGTNIRLLASPTMMHRCNFWIGEFTYREDSPVSVSKGPETARPVALKLKVR